MAIDANFSAVGAGESPYLITWSRPPSTEVTVHRVVSDPPGAPARLVASIPTENKSYSASHAISGPTGLLVFGDSYSAVDIRFVDPATDEVHLLMDEGEYRSVSVGGLVDDGTMAYFLFSDQLEPTNGARIKQLRVASFALSDPANTFTLGPPIAVSQATRYEEGAFEFGLLNPERYQVILSDSDGTDHWIQAYAFYRQTLSLDTTRSGRADDLSSSRSVWQLGTFDASRHTGHRSPRVLERYIEFDEDLRPIRRTLDHVLIRSGRNLLVGFPASYIVFGETDTRYLAYSQTGGGHVFEIEKATATIGRAWSISVRGLDFAFVQRAHLEGDAVTVAGVAQTAAGGRTGFVGSFSVAE